MALKWDDHYESSNYETWGSRHNKLQMYVITHNKGEDSEGYEVTWSGSHVATAPTLEGAKKAAAKDDKRRALARIW